MRRIVSSTGALKLKQIPKDMVVVGGGVIGLEMGSVWSRLGANVTVVEFTPTIVPSLDKDIRKAFERSLKKQGLKFQLGQKVLGTEMVGDRVKLSYEAVKDGKAGDIEADIVLVATGRRPYTGARSPALSCCTPPLEPPMCRCLRSCSSVCGVGLAVCAAQRSALCRALLPATSAMAKRLLCTHAASRRHMSRSGGMQMALASRLLVLPPTVAASQSMATSGLRCQASMPLATSSLARCWHTRPRRTASLLLRSWRAALAM